MPDLSQPVCGFHLELRVAHLADATHFYRTLFDREPSASAPETYSLFEFWDLQLLLLVGEPKKATFGFQLHSIEQLNLWEEQLIQRKISIERRQMNHLELGSTETTLNITDPDGHRCSFYVLLRSQPAPAPTTAPDSDSRSS